MVFPSITHHAIVVERHTITRSSNEAYPEQIPHAARAIFDPKGLREIVHSQVQADKGKNAREPERHCCPKLVPLEFVDLLVAGVVIVLLG